MTDLSDFLKVKTVRCVSKNAEDNLTIGKKYKVTHIIFGLQSDNNAKGFYDFDSFEPVIESAENPLQDMKLTPEFEVVEPVLADNSVNIQDIDTDILDTNADIKDMPKFKVGDKVYYGSEPDVLTILEFDVDGWARMDSWAGFVDSSRLCHATQENYERLQATFPNIKFEAPPKELKGSDLARAMLERGDRRIYGYASDNSDNDPHGYECVVRDYDVNSGFGVIMSNARYEFFNPCDPRTGEPLTEAVLDE